MHLVFSSHGHEWLVVLIQERKRKKKNELFVLKNNSYIVISRIENVNEISSRQHIFQE